MILRRVRTLGPRLRIVVGALIVLLIVGAFASWRLTRAYEAGIDGKAALISAEAAIAPGQTDEARRQLQLAQQAFFRMDREIRGMGPVGPALRIVPFVRAQMGAVDAINKTGRLLSAAGLELADATDQVTKGDEKVTAGAALPNLVTIHEALTAGADNAEEALNAVLDLEGKTLLRPLDEARDELLGRLGPVARQARSAERGVAGLRDFLGHNGPRRYLVFSQNPEELRPTGGYMGSYSVMSTTATGLKVEESAAIEDWLTAHPDVKLEQEQLGGIFQFASAPTLANVNFVADWNATGQLAAELWKQGGEPPVDGVIGITPAFLVQILKVTGPVAIPTYGETVSADNLIARFAFHTREVAARREDNTVRKGFATEVASVLLSRALAVPQTAWEELAKSLGEGFNARAAMVWSKDESVALALRERRWDGRLPEGLGDFFYNAEFAYGAKNGRELRRTFDHYVIMNKDGSALVSTTMTMFNPTPRDRLNPTSMLYIQAYGPTGAEFHEASTNAATQKEIELGGHPAAGFFVDPLPGGEAKLKVVWRVPNLARQRSDGTWSYDLRFMRVPDHTGDTLNLRVDLPRGWTWRDEPPPATTPLDKDLVGSWTFGPSA